MGTSLGSKPHGTYRYISLRTAIEYYMRTFYHYNLVQSNVSSLCSIIQCYDTMAHYSLTEVVMACYGRKSRFADAGSELGCGPCGRVVGPGGKKLT